VAVKRMPAIIVIVVLLAIVCWQQYRIKRLNMMHKQLTKEIDRMKEQENIYWLKELQRIPSDHRKSACAIHIGTLKGSKHDAALTWFKPFTDGSSQMTGDDLKKCEEL